MKTKSESGFTTLTNADNGEQVSVPNGTKVVVADDRGDIRYLATEHLTSRYDWPCMYEGQVYFVDKRSLVRNREAV